MGNIVKSGRTVQPISGEYISCSCSGITNHNDKNVSSSSRKSSKCKHYSNRHDNGQGIVKCTGCYGNISENDLFIPSNSLQHLIDHDNGTLFH